MLQDLSSFSKEIAKKVPALCLVIAKEEKEAIDLIIKHWSGRVRSFTGDNFSCSAFSNEVESYVFFAEPLLCYIKDIDKLTEDDRKKIISYMQNPNKQISLLLSSSLALLVKEVKKSQGLVLQLQEEKEWQKKQRLERLLLEESKSQGITFQLEAIKLFLNRVGLDRDLLFQEFEKLVTLTYPKKSISYQDVSELTYKAAPSSFWDLEEAICAKDLPLSLERAKALIEEGASFYSILAQLRTQFRILSSMKALFERGGSDLLVEEYPYLRGQILLKKIQEIKNSSAKSLKKALFFLFEAELNAKNSHRDPLSILEILILKLITSKV